MNQVSRSVHRNLWIAGTSITAVAAVATAGFLFRPDAANATAAPAPAAASVSVASVIERSAAPWDEFSGRLEAVERVDIRPRVPGTILAVHFREGELVKAGDLLYTIDPAPFEAEVERAVAKVAAAQARLSNAKTNAERAIRLLDDHAISQREHDESANAQDEASAVMRSAKAELVTARLNLGYTQVRAPVAGRIGKIETTVGNLVAAGPGAPVLTTLVSVNPIYASFDADEQIVTRALSELPQGAGSRSKIGNIPVRMGTAGETDTPFVGRLQLVDNQVNAKSGTVRVRAVFDNADGSLIPGQFARLRMGQSKVGKVLLISERAVSTDQTKKFVLVVNDDNRIAYREVILGPSLDGMRIVESGLKADEKIVVNGLHRVRPGELISPKNVDMSAAEVTAAN